MSNRCKEQIPHRRTSNGHGKNDHASSLNDYKFPLRKHTWVGHGKDRHCEHCGAKPHVNTGAVILSPPYWVDDEYQKKMAERVAEVENHVGENDVHEIPQLR